MEPTQAKPVNRRRRLIVAVVLVLVSLCSWWHWPRGDARFVGKWEQQDAGFGIWKIRLSRNGTGLGDTPRGIGSRFAWRVDGNRFIMNGSETLVRPMPFADWIVRSLVLITGRLWVMPGPMSFEISHVSETEVRLKRIDNGLELKWRRIPE